MSNEMLEYNGYHGSAETSLEDGILYGRVLFINDLVTYEGETLAELRREFEAAVDDYLATCAEIGKQPDKEYSGTFNVRVGPDLHRAAAIAAMQDGIPLNQFVQRALTQATAGADQEITHHHRHTHVVEHVTVQVPDYMAGHGYPKEGEQWKRVEHGSALSFFTPDVLTP